MNKVEWLQLAKERIECILHNYDDSNFSLEEAIKFLNEAMGLMKIDDEELQILRGLANIVCGFVDLKPEHCLYESMRQDVKDYLKQLKGDK